MAEIHVERKKRHSLWPWIVLIVIIAIAAWAVYTYGDRFGLHLHSAADATPASLVLASPAAAAPAG